MKERQRGDAQGEEPVGDEREPHPGGDPGVCLGKERGEPHPEEQQEEGESALQRDALADDEAERDQREQEASPAEDPVSFEELLHDDQSSRNRARPTASTMATVTLST